MLRRFSPHNSPRRERVCSLLTQFCIFSPKIHYSIEDAAPSISQTNPPHGDPPNFSGIARTVISKCSYLSDYNKGKSFTSSLLKDYLIGLLKIRPDIVRRFWRLSVLRPQDVLEILLAFESDEIRVKSVEYVWGIFNCATEQSDEFDHFPQSCKIMASMLARVGLFSEAESVLSRRETEGILLDCEEIFDNLIEGYAREFELDKAFSVYTRMRKLSLVPSALSYQILVNYLIELNETELMYCVYADMLMMGMRGNVEQQGTHEDVIRLLCIDGKVLESRDLVKKLASFGVKPTSLVVNAISHGYCAKKDYDDVLSFLAEVGIAPEVIVGNRILFSMCRDFGVDQASVFLQKLEGLGFCPDEISLGILIGFWCRDGKLKNALVKVLDTLSRGLRLNVHSYNALLSAMFKEGMWMLTRDVLAEMNETGIMAESSTFKVLLAGFCKARKFDEVKAIVHQMADHDLLTLSSLEDPLNKGFAFLGLNPLGVRIKRDNDKGFSKTEFYDNLGNGLYLDTDLDKFEKRIAEILDNAMLPDFNSSIIEKCHIPNLESALTAVDEMARWGQEMSLPVLSLLLDCLSRSPSSVETINRHLGVLLKSIYQLDQKTLNMLVRIYSKKGFTFKARTLFDGMLRRGYKIENGTYSSLLFNTCKKGDLKSFHYFYKLSQKYNYSPEVKDGKPLLSYVCRNKWINEAMELFETILLVTTSSDISDTFRSLLGELCLQGFTNMASVLLHEFSNRETVLDPNACSHLVCAFCLEKRLTEAMKLFEMMLSENLSPPLDVYTQLIRLLCWTNNFKKAVELKNTCLRDQPSAELPIDCTLITGLCKSGRAEDAGNLFKKTLLKGLYPDADVFNSLIKGYCRVNNLNKARELLGFMTRKNLSIHVSSYSNIAQLLCAGGRFSLAMSLNALMLRVTCLPEIVLHNILIFHVSSLKNSSLLDAAIDALKMKGISFNEVTYNFVIRGYILCNNIPRSHHYLTVMMKKDLNPSSRILREVIRCLCYNRQLQHALKLSRQMELHGWIHSSSIQNSIVEALLGAGKLQEAVGFLERLASKDLIPDNVQYDYLIQEFCRCGRMDKSIDLLNIMLMKGSCAASTSYDCLIQGFCNARKLDTAMDFYAEMLCRGMKPSANTWDVLVCRLCESDRVADAEDVLKSAIGLGEMPSLEAFRAVIDGYRAEKNVGKTAEVVEIMRGKGYVPDFDTHWSVVSNLSNSRKKDDTGFLSHLLLGFGFGFGRKE